MKYLLIIVSFGLLTYLSWRWLLRYVLRLLQRGLPSGMAQAPKNPPQMMVQCQHCGVHIAQQEAFYHAARPYCCAADAHATDSSKH